RAARSIASGAGAGRRATAPGPCWYCRRRPPAGLPTLRPRRRLPLGDLSVREDGLSLFRAETQESRRAQAQVLARDLLAVAAHGHAVPRVVQRRVLPGRDLLVPAGRGELAVDAVEDRLEQRRERMGAAGLLLHGRRVGHSQGLSPAEHVDADSDRDVGL